MEEKSRETLQWVSSWLKRASNDGGRVSQMTKTMKKNGKKQVKKAEGKKVKDLAHKSATLDNASFPFSASTPLPDSIL
jgi:hypothetical protein